ncbi:MAG: DegV family protein [Chloroflexia bacterium]|nr:DegV family protein [Chloroflexia bacterium]
MTRVAVVTDSSADLPPTIAASAGITVIPAVFSLGAYDIHGREPSLASGPERREPREFPGGEPAQAAIDAFADAFAQLAKTHDQIVAVLLSSRLGSSVAAALRASERMANALPIEVVDSRSASLGLGFQVIRAAELAGMALNAPAIAATLRAAVDRYHVVFSVESVEYLRQSGQIGRSAAMIAEALQIKPLVRIDEGQIVPYERARTRTRVIAELADFVREISEIERCAVLYATNRHDANRLIRTVAADTGLSPERLTLNQIGTLVAAQLGPGALGVAVVASDVR